MITAKVERLDRLRRKLRALPDALKEATREGFAQTAREMTGMMERIAPEISGDLKESIEWHFADNSDSRVGVKGREGFAVIITAGGEKNKDPGFYATHVEFGTAHSAAHPFFFPSYRALRRRGRARVSRKQSQALKRIAQQ